jgi:prepilin-type processing-associated H-X9-DG protein
MLRCLTARQVRSDRTGTSAFSLLEILLVVAITFVLTALMLPTLRSARDMAQRARCSSNMHHMGIAFRLYQSDRRGLYPKPWTDNMLNWQSYLCGIMPFDPWIGPNEYMPAEYLRGWDETSDPEENDNGNNKKGKTKKPKKHAKKRLKELKDQGLSNDDICSRLMGELLCPKMTEIYNLPDDDSHVGWGYVLNYTRVEISYGADGAPWNKAQYLNGDLDNVYPKSGISAVMTCGNNPSFNSDLDWNAFTATDPVDWAVVPVHGDFVNVLFLDGHVEGLGVTSTKGKEKFNFFWYNGIPTTLPNPW